MTHLQVCIARFQAYALFGIHHHQRIYTSNTRIRIVRNLDELVLEFSNTCMFEFLYIFLIYPPVSSFFAYDTCIIGLFRQTNFINFLVEAFKTREIFMHHMHTIVLLSDRVAFTQFSTYGSQVDTNFYFCDTSLRILMSKKSKPFFFFFLFIAQTCESVQLKTTKISLFTVVTACIRHAIDE